MKIIDYEEKYDEDIKNLLLELQEHITSIDEDGYNIVGNDFKEKYFTKTMNDYHRYEGKIFLAKDNDKIIGLIIGLINNLEIHTYQFKAPKRGRVSELVVSKDNRGQKVGKALLESMENYFKNIGCEAIILSVFGYNTRAIEFYNKNGYNLRTMDVMKKL